MYLPGSPLQKAESAYVKGRICLCERQDLSLEASAQVNVLLGFCYCTDVWSFDAWPYAKRHVASRLHRQHFRMVLIVLVLVLACFLPKIGDLQCISGQRMQSLAYARLYAYGQVCLLVCAKSQCVHHNQ